MQSRDSASPVKKEGLGQDCCRLLSIHSCVYSLATVLCMSSCINGIKALGSGICKVKYQTVFKIISQANSRIKMNMQEKIQTHSVLRASFGGRTSGTSGCRLFLDWSHFSAILTMHPYKLSFSFCGNNCKGTSQYR